MPKEDLFKVLQEISRRPKPFAYYTTPALWCDPYISKQMLKFHLAKDVEAASRNKTFIDRSADWILNHFNIGSASKVCDFGCGPGLYTTRFAQGGAAVTGVDFSEHSIQYAREAAIRHHLKVNHIQQDYLTFETEEKFDLITMIYCDFCTLNPEQRSNLSKKFYDLLSDSGRLLLDVSSWAYFDSMQEKGTYEFSPADGFWSADSYYVFQNTFKYASAHLLLEKFTIVESKRTRANYNWLQCYSLESIKDELKQGGLHIIEDYANVAGDLYRGDAHEIAVVAKKA